MVNHNQIKDEKLQYHVNGEATKIWALWSGKIDKYEYLTCEEVLPSNQKQTIEQAKAFKEQIKQQVKAIKDLNISDKTNELIQIEVIFPQNILNDLNSNKLWKIIELEDSIELGKLNYKNYDSNIVFLITIFLRDKYANGLSIEKDDNELNNLKCLNVYLKCLVIWVKKEKYLKKSVFKRMKEFCSKQEKMYLMVLKLIYF